MSLKNSSGNIKKITKKESTFLYKIIKTFKTFIT